MQTTRAELPNPSRGKNPCPFSYSRHPLATASHPIQNLTKFTKPLPFLAVQDMESTMFADQRTGRFLGESHSFPSPSISSSPPAARVHLVSSNLNPDQTNIWTSRGEDTLNTTNLRQTPTELTKGKIARLISQGQLPSQKQTTRPSRVAENLQQRPLPGTRSQTMPTHLSQPKCRSRQ